MVRKGIRPSSRSVATRLSTLTPRRCRPKTTPSSPAGGRAAAPARRASPSNVDVLGDLYRSHRQLDDFPSALSPAPSQVSPAIGTVLHHVLHPLGGRHTPAGKAVASLLVGQLLHRRLAARFRLQAGHPGLAARFHLAFQFGNPPLQPLNHRL